VLRSTGAEPATHFYCLEETPALPATVCWQGGCHTRPFLVGAYSLYCI